MMNQTEIGIDIETKSGVNLNASNVYRYVEDKDFAILLFSYSINGAYPICVDLANGDTIPKEIMTMLVNENIVKTAFNANFERVCINKFFNLNVPPSQWDCTMVRAAMLSLPLSLENCSKILNVQNKDKIGKQLIAIFSVKMIPPRTFPDKWELFKQYNIDDVVSEQQIRQKIKAFPISPFERSIWSLDQKLNDYGIEVDMNLVHQALKCANENTAELIIDAKNLTNLNNPNSPAQVKKWINERTGLNVTTLAKGTLFETDDDDVNSMLDIRKELSKTSVKKYVKIANGVCQDGRCKGLLQIYGANRTGRWGGRGIQVHNLPRNTMKGLDTARKLLLAGEFETIKTLFGSISNVLSQLIRTAFVPAKGCKFIVSDFSAIEARVTAWLCNEKWRLDVFKTHGKIYEASAAMMFNVPIESVTKGSDLRSKGKVAELALGYQGSVGALERMGGREMGLDEDDMLDIVRKWRKASPNIKRFWYEIQEAVASTILDGATRRCGRIVIHKKSNILFLFLPSGRHLAYFRPTIMNEKIFYEGLDQTTKQWVKIPTYGGKLLENIVQAISRDILAEKMLKLDSYNYFLAMHVHDEIIVEAPEDNIKDDMRVIDYVMAEEIPWAKGLPLKGDSFITDYYKKD